MRPRLWARFLFAAIGAAGCLLAALSLEGFYAPAHTGAWLSHDDTPSLLFFHRARTNTEKRLRDANAQSGDVEVTLTWNNLNDLDLHCVDPNGEEIKYDHKLSDKTGGALDVDQNMSPPYTQQPVEHIFWPRGRAPIGRYLVYVHHYARHGGSDPTPFEVTVNEHGRVLHFPGTISHGYERRAGDPGMFVCEFRTELRPFELFGLSEGFWRATFVVGLWCAVLAAALAAALLTGLNVFYRRIYKVRSPAAGKMARIVAVGSIWGAIGGALTQAAFALAPSFLGGPAALSNGAGFGAALLAPAAWRYAAGMALIAAVIGTALGGRVPNLKRGWAFLAGVVGGTVAGYLFLAIYVGLGASAGSEMWARPIAAALIGASIGFVIALIVEEPEEPPEPEEFEDETLDAMQPLSLRANTIGPTGKLRRASGEPLAR